MTSINARLAVSEGLRRYWSNPMRRARMAETQREAWSDPERRERQRRVALAAAKDEGVPMFDWTPARVAALRRCIERGVSWAGIARILGCTDDAARNKARRLGRTV